MKCPNCGRTVRSKSQCAHCGYVFGSSDAKRSSNTQANEEDNYVAPKKPATDIKLGETIELDVSEMNSQPEPEQKPEDNFKYVDDNEDLYVYEEEEERGGCRRIISFLIQLIVGVVVVFLLFLYGPRIYEKAMSLIKGGDNQTEEAAKELTSDQASSVEPVVEEVAVENPVTPWQFVTNTDAYPLVTIKMTSDKPVDLVDSNTFKFELTNGNTASQAITDYSLAKEGNDIILSFRDPAVNVVAAEPQDQSLAISSESLGMTGTVTYSIPTNGVNKDLVEEYNKIINNAFSKGEEVTALIGSAKEGAAPFIYDNQTKEAGSLISWYIIERVYQAIEAKTLTLEDTLTLNIALIADGDTTSEEGKEVTIDELLDLVIQSQDLTAMNHLIQQVGGPNEFNIWLNENSYFSTRVNNLLSVSESGQVAGSVTNVQDLGQLLHKLANDELVSKEASEAIKKKLLLSPETAKYPEAGIDGITKRYEITSSDLSGQQQYYSAVLETETENYVVILKVNNFEDAAATVANVSTVINETITYALKGANTGEQASSSTDSSSSSSDESIKPEVSETPEASSVAVEPTQVTTSEPVYTEPVQVEQYDPQYNGYYEQYVSGQDQYVQLPDRSIINANGERVEPKWYFDEASNSYMYTFE